MLQAEFPLPAHGIRHEVHRNKGPLSVINLDVFHSGICFFQRQQPD